jgi:hypothetical protein
VRPDGNLPSAQPTSMRDTRPPRNTIGRTPPEERRQFGYRMVPVRPDGNIPFPPQTSMCNTRAPYHTLGRTPPEERLPFGYTMVPVTFDEHPPFSTQDTHLPCSQTTDDNGGRRHTAGEQSELAADDGDCTEETRKRIWKMKGMWL